MTFYKLLKIIFVILLLVTFGEVGFVVYYQVNREKYTQNESSSLVSEKLLSPTLILQNRLISAENLEYLKSEFIPSLENIPKSNNRKFYLIEENSGYVGEFKLDNKKRGYMLKIIDEKGNNVISYFISEKNIGNKRIYKMNGDIKMPVSYKEIRASDKIRVTIYNDLVNSDNGYDEYVLTE